MRRVVNKYCWTLNIAMTLNFSTVSAVVLECSFAKNLYNSISATTCSMTSTSVLSSSYPAQSVLIHLNLISSSTSVSLKVIWWWSKINTSCETLHDLILVLILFSKPERYREALPRLSFWTPVCSQHSKFANSSFLKIIWIHIPANHQAKPLRITVQKLFD